MPRMTLDIDASVLDELRRLQRERKATLGELASELLADALAADREAPPPLRWRAQAMGARVDLEDKEAVRRALDES